MNTLPIDLYKVIEYGLGGDTWQEFIDRYKEKYDLLQIDGFEFEATKLDYTFSQLITSLGVKTLPAYVDPESPGYEAALGELEGSVFIQLSCFKCYFQILLLHPYNLRKCSNLLQDSNHFFVKLYGCSRRI